MKKQWRDVKPGDKVVFVVEAVIYDIFNMGQGERTIYLDGTYPENFHRPVGSGAVTVDNETCVEVLDKEEKP